MPARRGQGDGACRKLCQGMLCCSRQIGQVHKDLRRNISLKQTQVKDVLLKQTRERMHGVKKDPTDSGQCSMVLVHLVVP